MRKKNLDRLESRAHPLDMPTASPLPTFRVLVADAARAFLAVSSCDGNALKLRDLAGTGLTDDDVFTILGDATIAIVAVVSVLADVGSDRLTAALAARKAMHRATMAYFGVNVDAPAEHDVCPVAIPA